MSEKFNPAPTDKHADDLKQAVKSDKKLQSELDKGLEGTFPASDPPSSTEPAKSKGAWVSASCSRLSSRCAARVAGSCACATVCRPSISKLLPALSVPGCALTS